MFEKYSKPLCARVTGLGGRSRPLRLWLNYIPLSAPRKTAAVLSSLCSAHITHKLVNRPSARPHIHAQTCTVTQVTATPTCSHTHTHTHTLAQDSPVERTSRDCRLFSLHRSLCFLPANELVMGVGFNVIGM